MCDQDFKADLEDPADATENESKCPAQKSGLRVTNWKPRIAGSCPVITIKLTETRRASTCN